MDNQVTYFSLAFFPFCPYTISMLSSRTGLPQYKNSPPKAQIPAYLQKVVDTHSFVGIITQQLSNSATQQLSNSATQQLDCTLKNRPLFYSDNNIIIFSHQFLQTAQAVLVFLSLHTDSTLLFSVYFVRWVCKNVFIINTLST